jgi:hypothetical protein
MPRSKRVNQLFYQFPMTSYEHNLYLNYLSRLGRRDNIDLRIAFTDALRLRDGSSDGEESSDAVLHITSGEEEVLPLSSEMDVEQPKAVLEVIQSQVHNHWSARNVIDDLSRRIYPPMQVPPGGIGSDQRDETSSIDEGTTESSSSVSDDEDKISLADVSKWESAVVVDGVPVYGKVKRRAKRVSGVVDRDLLAYGKTISYMVPRSSGGMKTLMANLCRYARTSFKVWSEELVLEQCSLVARELMMLSDEERQLVATITRAHARELWDQNAFVKDGIVPYRRVVDRLGLRCFVDAFMDFLGFPIKIPKA